MRVLSAFALSVTLALTLTPAVAQEKELVIGRSVSTNAMDPGFMREAATIVDNIFDTLVMRDTDMNLVPGLATEWRSIDALTWEFKLRDGVKFHNGEAFDAAAVKFTLDRVLNPEAKSPAISYIRTIASVDVVDPMTVRITTTAADPLLPTRMSRYPAYIVPPKYVTEIGDAEFASHPVGTGAYSFVEFVPDERVVLAANAEYWRGKPQIDEVIWRPIPDDTARITALITGEVDLIENVPVDLAPMLAGSPDAELVQVKNGGLVIYLGLRMDKAPLDNLQVRQALNHAIDRQGITDNLLQGLATPVGSQVGNTDFGYLDLPVPAYDPALSRKLLAEAGFPDGFEITMQSSSRYMKNSEVAQAIAQQFGDVGIKVKQEVMEWSVYTQKVPFDGPIYMLGWGSTQTLDADAAIYAIMRSGEPYSGATLPDLDKLLDESRSTVDPVAREAVLHDIQTLAAAEVPLISLYREDALLGRASDVTFTGRPDARIVLFDMNKD
jgi:peptide/nickel transport system substrate-binding protein